MKILHTADWHVGKLIRGRSRADEHRDVLTEISSLADREQVDLVLVAGDLFEMAAPSPESEEIVYRALLDLAATGAEILVVAGNHDNARRLRAVAPLLDLGRVHVLAEPARPDEGGLRIVRTRSGESARVALLPFVSQRSVVRADQLLHEGADQRSGTYADRVREVIAALCDGFRDDSVNLLAAHLFVDGGRLGGGERSGHTVFDYAVSTAAFPADAHYAALGHLHRSQQLPGPCPIRYSGSPLQLDFGEQDDTKSVTLVEVAPSTPAQVRVVELSGGRMLRTLEGPIDELRDRVRTTGDAWLRVRVHEQVSVGLADQLREWFPEVVDIQVVRPDDDPGAGAGAGGPAPLSGSPLELFAAYLREQQVDDERVGRLFAELLGEVSGDPAPETTI